MSIDDDGNFTLQCDDGDTISFVFAFAPAMWGEHTVSVGTRLKTPADGQALLKRVGRALQVPLPAATAADGADAPLFALELTSRPGGFDANAILLMVDGSRTSLRLYLHCRWDGAAHLQVLGPSGARARATVAGLAVQHFTWTASGV